MEFICHIHDGEILNKTTVRKHFDDLKDGRYLVRIDSRNKRTLPMNAYLHGVLIPEFRKALNSVGYDEVRNDAQAKLIMKSMFLTDTITNKETGEMINYVKDTHELTTLEMSTLFDDVIKFCAENMNHTIPYPNEQLQFFE
jgi:hypothetical protein